MSTDTTLHARPLLHTPMGDYPADAAVCYTGGAVRTVRLWPGAEVAIPTPAGQISTAIGFSMYEDGRLESIEPAQPAPVTTPMGTLPAYDALAEASAAGLYSLQFEPDGRVRGLTLSDGGIHVQYDDGRGAWVYPQVAAADPMEEIDDDGGMLLPIRVDIREDAVVVRSGDATALFPAFHTRFTVQGGCAGGCSGCSGCSGCR